MVTVSASFLPLLSALPLADIHLGAILHAITKLVIVHAKAKVHHLQKRKAGMDGFCFFAMLRRTSGKTG